MGGVKKVGKTSQLRWREVCKSVGAKTWSGGGGDISLSVKLS